MAANSSAPIAGLRPRPGDYNAFPSAIPPQDGYWVQTQTAIGSGATPGQFKDIATLIVPYGVWLILAQWDLAAQASETDAQIALSLNADNTTTDHIRGINQLSLATVAAAGVGSGFMSWIVPVTKATGTVTIHQKAQITGGSAANSWTGDMKAILLKAPTDMY